MQVENVFGSGNMKIGYRVEVVGGMIPFTNSWMLKGKGIKRALEEEEELKEDDEEEEEEEEEVERLYEKTLDLYYTDFEGMSQEQANEWKNQGFDYASVSSWIDIAGLKTTEAKFAYWLINEKGGKMADATFIRTKCGKKVSGEAIPTLEELREEFGKV